MFGLNKVTGRGRQTVEALKMYNDGTVTTKTDTFNYTGNPEGVINYSVSADSKVKKTCYILMTAESNIDAITVDYGIELGAAHSYGGNFITSGGNYTLSFLIEWTNGIVKVWENGLPNEFDDHPILLRDVFPTGMKCIDEPLTVKYMGDHDPGSASNVKIETTIIYN